MQIHIKPIYGVHALRLSIFIGLLTVFFRQQHHHTLAGLGLLYPLNVNKKTKRSRILIVHSSQVKSLRYYNASITAAYLQHFTNVITDHQCVEVDTLYKDCRA